MDDRMTVELFIFLFVLVVVFKDSPRKRRIKQAYKFNPPTSHGNSKFADDATLRRAGLFDGKGIPIGYSSRGHALHFSGAGHFLTVCAARGGKGATLLLNALLSVRYSCLVVDPKAENAVVSAHRRQRFGQVYILNPFGMFLKALKGLKQARFNPMDIIDVNSTAFHVMCDKLAAALVWDEGPENNHFTAAARIIVSGVVAALMLHGAASEKNLAAVSRIISGDIFAFCRVTVKNTTDPFIIQKLGRFAAPGAKDIREVNDVISTATTQLGFIANAALADSLSGSDFRFSDLKRKRGTSIYICLPLDKLDVCDKYFRLILETALTDLLNEGLQGAGEPVLAIIDEMAQLGPQMKSLENAMGMAAGAAGLKLWCVLQDLSQLKGMFPKTWETFIQGCSVTTWWGARDQTTREYVSKLGGTVDTLSRSRSVAIDHQTGEPNVSDSANQFGRPLLLPEEVASQLASDEMIMFVDSVRCGPIKAKRRFYFHVFPARYFRRNPYVKKNNGFLDWLFR